MGRHSTQNLSMIPFTMVTYMQPVYHIARWAILCLAILLSAVPALAQRTTKTQTVVLDDNQGPASTITLQTPTVPFTSWTMTLPDGPPGSAGSLLTSDLTGKLAWLPGVPQSGYWTLTGNAGTTAGTNFIGTTDNIAFQIHVNNVAAGTFGTSTQGNGRVMRFEPTNLSPNILGGHHDNSITTGARGATIAGGGSNVSPNSITGATTDFATISGGVGNTASAPNATVVGGTGNTASGDAGTVGGTSSTASGANSVAFGTSVTASGAAAVAMGGSTLARGNNSVAMGLSAQTAVAATAAISLGNGTNANGVNSVAMGNSTTASGNTATAMGGSTTASGDTATAMGNSTNASGRAATAMGSQVTASGSNSIAMGQWVTANAANAMVLGKGVSNGTRLVNSTANSLMVGFNSASPTLFVGPYTTQADNRGYVGIGTATPQARLVVTGADDLPTSAALNVTNNAGVSALLVTNNRKTGIGGFNVATNDTPKARLHVRGLSDGDFTSILPTLALNISNAAGDPLLLVRDDGRMMIGTASAPFAGLTSKGSIGPSTSNTYDLGSCDLQWRDVYVNRDMLFTCNTATGHSRAKFNYNTATTAKYLEVSVGSGAVAPTTAMVIAENNKRVGLTDGGGTTVPDPSFNATGSGVAPQGALDVRSSTGALIIPRMTAVQRLALPLVLGSMVYQTDSPAGPVPPASTEGFWVVETVAGAPTWVRK
ncbi:MAG: hypothetical protein DYG96_09090 [Chlorobi bacterium CHB2]|nr:hypothetical protein [Chlorobi bacterium CHB2]